MTAILTHIQNWFRRHRPELSKEEKLDMSNTAYREIVPYLEKADNATKIILVNEHLLQNYHYSAYNLVKDVFSECLPIDYQLFRMSPIFFDLNDGILESAVEQGLFAFKGIVVGEDRYNDNSLRKDLLEIIKIHIS